MTQDKYANIYNKVKEAMEKDRLFLRPELSLVLLSRLVGTNTVYLSQAINQGFGCSFTRLVNKYRIEYLVKESLRTNVNIEILVSKYGFWSRSTFYDAFRLYTGMTPRRYMEKQKTGIDEGDGSTAYSTN